MLLPNCSPKLVGQTMKFMGLRYDQQMQLDNSLIWQVSQAVQCDYDQVQFVGWELNRNSKMGPRMVNMRDSMDPAMFVKFKLHAFLFM